MEQITADIVYFYDPNAENGWLANFSSHPIKLDGVIYKTVEHFFQAQKFSEKAIVNEILNAQTPKEAKAIAKQKRNIRRTDWGIIKEEIMYRGIKTKFSQYNELKKLLLLTDEKVLIEKSDEDYYWGIGNNGTGKNRMGELLMKLRNELKDH